MSDIHTESLDLNLLAVLDAMFREGSVTRAGVSLGFSQSAMSHSLNRLRAFFDDQLFVKSSNAMVPTPKAEAMRGAVVDVMSTVRQQILAGARFEPKVAKRVFTLCMTDMGELVFLPPLLERFKNEAPHCSIRTVQVPTEQIEQLLAACEADLALGSIRSAPEGLFQQKLFLHSFVTIVSARNRSVGKTLTLEQFEAMPHVAVSLTGRSSESYDQVLIEQGVKRNIAVMTPHFLMVPLLMERHPELIATVPMELVAVFARLGTIRMFDPPLAVPQFALNQHWHPRFHHDPAIIWLREMIKKTFENYPRIVTKDPVVRSKSPRVR